MKMNLVIELNDEETKAVEYGTERLIQEKAGEVTSVEDALSYVIKIQVGQWLEVLRADKGVENKEIINKLALVDDAKRDQVKSLLGI